MDRARLLREVRMARFEELYESWRAKGMTQQEAGHVLGVTDRTFRRYVTRYEAEGTGGLADRRKGRSHRRAPEEEMARVRELYGKEHEGWNVRHFHQAYRAEHGGGRSYTWVKNVLQEAGLVKKGRRRGPHRMRRPRKRAAGMMVHQDGSTHEWVEGKTWDLIVTMDDATSEVYSGFFVEQEGTWSSFRGVREAAEVKGLFASFYSDRGSHYWTTPKAGGKVDPERATQFGRAMKELGIQMIPSYSPQARGRSERFFGTLQGRLPQELARAGITEMEEANAFLKAYWPRFNAEFSVEAEQEQTVFTPLLKAELSEFLCLKAARTVGNDNCVSYRGKKLQIPPQRHRHHYAKAKVEVREHEDGTLAVFHGGRRLGSYDPAGRLEGSSGAVREVAPVRTDRSKPAITKSFSPKPRWKPAPDHPWRRRARAEVAAALARKTAGMSEPV